MDTGLIPSLEAIRVTKRFRGGVLALDSVSMTVPSGSITALVGPNAAGKSTLMRTWVGFERPTSGAVSVSGINPWRDRSGALERLAYVPQSPALYRGLAVVDHLRMASYHRTGFQLDAVTRHLSGLGIPLGVRPTSLSGGQQAQLMLAIALGTGAQVLLLDEPLASLDPLARSEFLGIMNVAIRDRDGTALLSSHIVTDIERVCDRVIVMSAGRILLDSGIPEAVAGHRLVDESGLTDSALTVGRFTDNTGKAVALRRLGTGIDQGCRPATLEDVVKGYLASGRTNRGCA